MCVEACVLCVSQATFHCSGRQGLNDVCVERIEINTDLLLRQTNQVLRLNDVCVESIEIMKGSWLRS